MAARWVAMVVWAAAAASAVFWGYRLLAKPPAVPAQATVAEATAPPVGGDLTRLFGAPAPVVAAPVEAAPPADARFKLVGVVAPVAGQRAGLALISVDGKAPRAIGIGGVVEGDVSVVSVSHRRVELGARGGGATVSLELPAVPEAARGTLDASPGDPTLGAPMQAPPPAVVVVPPAVTVPPPATAVPPAFPPRPAVRQGAPGSVSVPNAVPPQAVPQAPFGVTPQPAMPSGNPQGGPATS